MKHISYTYKSLLGVETTFRLCYYTTLKVFPLTFVHVSLNCQDANFCNVDAILYLVVCVVDKYTQVKT